MRRIPCLVLAGLLLLSPIAGTGCSSKRGAGERKPEPFRGGTPAGTLVVVPARHEARQENTLRTRKSRWRLIGEGAGGGAVLGMALAVPEDQEWERMSDLAAGLVLAGLGAVAGGIYGIFASPTEVSTRDGLVAYAPAALEGIPVQERLAESVALLLEVKGRPRPAVIGDLGPETADESVDYMPLYHQEIRTVLEVAVARIALEGREGEGGNFRLVLSGRIRLVDTATGDLLAERAAVVEGGSRPMSIWGEEGFPRLRGAVAAAIPALAKELADPLFPP